MGKNAKITTFQRINKGLEYFWLGITVLSARTPPPPPLNEGYDEAKWYLLFPLLALAMYLMRRGLRKKFEAAIRRQEEEEQIARKQKHK